MKKVSKFDLEQTVRIISAIDIRVGDYVRFDQTVWHRSVKHQDNVSKGIDEWIGGQVNRFHQVRDISLECFSIADNDGYLYRIDLVIGEYAFRLSLNSNHLVVVDRTLCGYYEVSHPRD